MRYKKGVIRYNTATILTSTITAFTSLRWLLQMGEAKEVAHSWTALLLVMMLGEAWLRTINKEEK